MAWVKVPKEHHPLFLQALPTAPDIGTMAMFGGIAVTVNGNIAAGLFARSVMLRLNATDEKTVLAMDGATYFDPMGKGREAPGKVMLPEEMLHRPAELRSWIDKAVALARTLPSKKKPAPKKKAKRRAK